MPRIVVRQPIGADATAQRGLEAEVGQRLPQHAVFLPPPGVHVDGAWQLNRPADLAQPPHQQHVFHQACFGKASQLGKGQAADKDTLVAIRSAEESGPQPVAKFQRA